MSCPFTIKSCKYCTIKFCGEREEESNADTFSTTIEIPKKTMKQEEKIKGWIARDNYPEKLHFFERKPRKDGLCWNYGYRRIELPTELFPEIKWSSEPIKVELIIKKNIV